MAREVVWTDPAWEDLEAAAEYIARDSEYYAAALTLPDVSSTSVRSTHPPLIRRPSRRHGNRADPKGDSRVAGLSVTKI